MTLRKRHRKWPMKTIAGSPPSRPHGSGVARIRRTLVILAVVAGVTLGVRHTPAMHLASLSADLLAWQTNPSSLQVRIIAPGSRTELDALLARHPVAVVRWLSGGVGTQRHSHRVAGAGVGRGGRSPLRRRDRLPRNGRLGSVDGC